MFIELPITLVNIKEREMVAENASEVPASMMVRLDCIQDVQECPEPNVCMLTLATGTRIEIPMSYINLKKILLRAWEIRGGIFFASYSNKNVDNTIEKVEQRCCICDGINLEICGEAGSPDGNTIMKKCKDCGGITHESK